jgi:chondroitin 4-sulfotransferase 11
MKMISDKHKFIFVHIHRTGGTSIESHFGCKIYDHRKCPAYIKRFGMDVWNEYFTFSLIRNPWNKMLGHYMWRQQKSMRNLKGDDLSFRDWVLQFENNIKGKGSLGDKGTPQYNQLFSDDVQLVDFIGRFENLQEDFNIVCDKIGIPRQELPHKNETKHKHYTEYYDDETRQIVAEKYKKDIEYFGYEFGE